MNRLRRLLAPAAGPAGSMRRRFLSGAFWSLIGNFAVQAIRIPAGVVIARVLGAENYGALGMINNTVGMFDQVSRLQLGATASNYVAALHRKDPARAARIASLTSIVGFVSGAVMCAIVVCLAPWLCKSYLHRPDLTPLLRLSGVMLLWGGLSAGQNGVLQGLEKFKLLALLGMASAFVSIFLRTGGVLIWGLTGVVIGMILTDGFDWLIDHLALRRVMRESGMKFGIRGTRRELDVLIHFSLPASLGAMILGPTIWFVHSSYTALPDGYRSLGIFNAVYAWQALACTVPQVLGGVLIPLLASQRDDRHPNLESFNLLMGWVLVTGMALPFLAYPDLIQLVHGRAFAGPDYQRALILVMAFACIESYNMGIARQIQVKRMLWWGFAANALWCVALIVASHMLRGYGAPGLAGAYAIAYALKTGVFAPLHIARGVVPRELMLAPSVMMVWTALAALGIVSFFGAPIWVRGIAFVACAELAVAGFHFIAKRGTAAAPATEGGPS